MTRPKKTKYVVSVKCKTRITGSASGWGKMRVTREVEARSPKEARKLLRAAAEAGRLTEHSGLAARKLAKTPKRKGKKQ